METDNKILTIKMNINEIWAIIWISMEMEDSMSSNVRRKEEEEMSWASAWIIITIEVDLYPTIKDIFSDPIWENQQKSMRWDS